MKTLIYCFIVLLISTSVKSQQQEKKSEITNKVYSEEMQNEENGRQTFKIKFEDGKTGLLVKVWDRDYYIEKEGPYKKDDAINILYKKLHPETNQLNGTNNYGGVGGGANYSEEKYNGITRKIFTNPDGSKYYEDDKGNKVYVYKNGKVLKKSDNEKRAAKEKLAKQNATQSSSGQRLKKDGTPDRRYKENRSSKTGSFGNSSSKSSGRSGG